MLENNHIENLITLFAIEPQTDNLPSKDIIKILNNCAQVFPSINNTKTHLNANDDGSISYELNYLSESEPNTPKLIYYIFITDESMVFYKPNYSNGITKQRPRLTINSNIA